MSVRALTLCLVLALAAACDLPQNKDSSSETDASGDSTGTGEVRDYRSLRLVDRSGAEDSPAPGSDIDALVVFRDGEFLFAGCTTVSLFDQDIARYPTNPHNNPTLATLQVREEAPAAGFVSLAGGVLICELPVAARTGDTLVVWENSVDGAESWEAAFAERAGETFVTAEGTIEGSGEVVVP